MTDPKSINNFNSFSNFLNSLRDNDGRLNLEEVKQAKYIAESLETKNEIPHALDYLKSETTEFGTKAAKYFYSYGSELKLSSLLAVINDNEKKEYLKKIFSEKEEITLDFVKHLSEDNQTRIVNLADEAASYYNEQAKKNRATHSPEDLLSREIMNFNKYARNFSI